MGTSGAAGDEITSTSGPQDKSALESAVFVGPKLIFTFFLSVFLIQNFPQ